MAHVEDSEGRALLVTVETADLDEVTLRIDYREAASLLEQLRREVGPWLAERDRALAEWRAGAVDRAAANSGCRRCGAARTGDDGALCRECGAAIA